MIIADTSARKHGRFPGPVYTAVYRHVSNSIFSAALAILILLAGGCAAFRSDIGGAYNGQGRPVDNPRKVSVAFLFSHVRQTKGFDAVPKVVRRYPGFDDFFRDALPELERLGTYSTFTEQADDVNDPARRARRDSLTTASDYTVRMRFLTQTSFPRQALGTIASTFSATLLPVPYTRHYEVVAEVCGPEGKMLKRYERSADITRWVEMFLLFAYPFHPETRKTEEMYVLFLHDIFREMNADGILAASTNR